MGKYFVELEERAKKEIIAHYKSGHQSSINNIKKILTELSETPYNGTGKPEALKHELSGFWSRRINRKDRLIYKISELTVTVLVISASGHYEKKKS